MPSKTRPAASRPQRRGALSSEQIQSALNASGERFRRLAEHAHDILYHIRLVPSPKFEYVSPAVTEITGYTSAEHYADPELGLKIVLPEDRPKLEAYWRGEGQFKEPLTLRWRRKDGAIIWTEQRNTPIYDPQGQLIALEGIARDVTARVRAETRLKTHLAIADILAHNPALDDATPQILQAICVGFDCVRAESWCALWQVDPPAAALRCVADWQSEPNPFPEFARFARETQFARGVGLPGRVWASGKPLWIPDVTQDADFLRANIAAHEGLRAAFAFPIRLGADVLGVMAFFSREIREPDAELLQWLEGIGAQIGQFIARKRAEDASLASENRFRALIENSADAIALLDRQGKLLRFNSPAAGKILGYAMVENEGRSLLELVHPDDQGRIAGELACMMAEPASLATVQLRARHADGTWRWIEATGMNLLAEPAVGAIVVNYRDITARKQAEEAIRQSEERFSRAFNASPAGIAISALDDGRMIDINPSFLRIFGYAREEIIGRKSLELNLWANPADRASIVQALRQDGHAHNLEIQARAKSGEIRDVLVSIELISIGNERCMLSVVHDVTQVKRAEQEARLLQTIALGISTAKDLNATIENILHLVCEATGWTMGEAWIPSADGTRLECHPAWHSRADGLEEFRAASATFTFAPGVGLPGRAWLSRKPVWSEDVTQAPNFPRAELARQAGLKAAVSIPVLAGDDVTMVLDFFLREPRAQDQHLIELIAAIAAELGVVIERKRAEEALRASAAGLAEAQRLAHLGNWERDLRTDELFGSEEAYHILGISAQKLPVALFVQLVHPDDRDKMDQAVRAAVREHEQTSIECRLLRPDGIVREIYGEIQAQFDSTGKAVRLVGTIQDITERKQRERELEAIAALSAALRQAPARAEMIPTILDQLLVLLRVDGASLVVRDPQTNENVTELARGAWADLTGTRLQPGEGISGHVILTGETYVTHDAAHDPHFARPRQIADARAAACVPLIAQEQTLGALWVASRREIAPAQVRLLTAVADIAANALHRATLHEQTEQQVERLTALHAIDLAISSSVDLRVTLDVFLSHVINQLGADAAAVFLYDPDARTLHYAAARGFRSRAIEKAVTRVGEGLAGRAALERRTIGIADIARSPDSLRAHPLFAQEGFAACYCVPLIAKGEIRGALNIFQRTPLAASPEWLTFLEALATEAAIAIDNAQLFERLRRSNLDLTLAYDATIEGWSHALDLRDKETEGHTQRVTEMTLRLARAGNRRRGTGADSARRALARHRQDGRAGRDSVETGRADGRGMGRHAPASGVRVSNARADSLPPTRARHSVLPSRKMGWYRLSARVARRSDSAGGAPLCGGGCVGRAALGPPVSERVGRGARARVHSGAGGQAFRPAGGEGVFGVGGRIETRRVSRSEAKDPSGRVWAFCHRAIFEYYAKSLPTSRCISTRYSTVAQIRSIIAPRRSLCLSFKSKPKCRPMNC